MKISFLFFLIAAYSPSRNHALAQEVTTEEYNGKPTFPPGFIVPRLPVALEENLSPKIPPSEQPESVPGKFTVLNIWTYEICIIIQIKSVLTVQYKTTNGTVGVNHISIPDHAPTDFGDYACDVYKKKQEVNVGGFKMVFQCTGPVYGLWCTESYVVSEMTYTVHLYPDSFPNALIPNLRLELKANASDLPKVQINVNNSYECNSEMNLVLPISCYSCKDSGFNARDYNATLKISHLQVEAFRNRTDTIFSPAISCPAKSSASSNYVNLTIGIIIALVIAAIVGVGFYFRKKKGSFFPYREFHNFIVSYTT